MRVLGNGGGALSPVYLGILLPEACHVGVLQPLLIFSCGGSEPHLTALVFRQEQLSVVNHLEFDYLYQISLPNQ